MASSQNHKSQLHSTRKDFLLFISIPIGVVILVAAILTVPSLFAKPKYSFIYSECRDYACSKTFSLEANGQIVETTQANVYTATLPELYLYDSVHNTSRVIDLIATRTYRLDTNNVSPDGYILTQANSSGGGFLFWGSGSDYNWYLKNGLKKKQINLANTNNYGNDIKFLGWINQ